MVYCGEFLTQALPQPFPLGALRGTSLAVLTVTSSVGAEAGWMQSV